MPVARVQLTVWMDLTSGRRAITVGIIDGPVAMNHPDLSSEHTGEMPRRPAGIRAQRPSTARVHGTFAAEISCAKRCAVVGHLLVITSGPQPMTSGTEV
jgi:hypothetical protein